MAKLVWSCSSALLTIALAAGLGLGAAGCAVESDTLAPAEPAAAEQSSPLLEASAPAGVQIFFVCEDDQGGIVGFNATLAACRATCPAGDHCFSCRVLNGVSECND